MKIKNIIRNGLDRLYKRKGEENPLTTACNDFGVSPQELEQVFNKYGDFLATTIMARFVERAYNPEFYDLNAEAKQFECANLFVSVMSDFLEERERIKNKLANQR